MARGASAGLLDEQRAQSVHKHAIIGRYLPVFIAKTGVGGPVALVDGFAGTGRAGGSLGSSGLMLAAATKMHAHRDVRIYLVEQNRARHAELAALTAEFQAAGVSAEARRCNITEELHSIIEASMDASLFLFLDPCGAQLPFDQVASALQSRRRAVRPTEACLNLSADLTRRAAGQLLRPEGSQSGVGSLDAVCGGQWWHQIVHDLAPGPGDSFKPIAEAVAAEYAHRLCGSTQMTSLVIGIARNERHQALYHLVFLTGSDHGLAAFADAIGRARPDWIEATQPSSDPSQGDLLAVFGDQFTPKGWARRRAESERDATVDEVVANLRSLAAREATFTPLEHVTEIYGHALGTACDTQIARALRRLVDGSELVVLRPHARPMQRTYGRRPQA